MVNCWSTVHIGDDGPSLYNRTLYFNRSVLLLYVIDTNDTYTIPWNYYWFSYKFIVYIVLLFTINNLTSQHLWGKQNYEKVVIFFSFTYFLETKKKKRKEKKQLTHGSVCVKDGWQNHKIILFVVWFWCLWYFQMEQNISWNLTRYPFFHQSPCGIQCRL